MEDRTERTPSPTPREGERPARPRSAPAQQKKARPRGVVVADPIADMLTRLRNGARARHDAVNVPASKLRTEIAKILKAEGFLAGYEVQGHTLTCRIKFIDGGRIAALTDAKRISTSGRRIYAGRHEIPLVRRGLGVTVVSTSQGVMTGKDAAKKGLGGEVLCTVW